MCVYIYDSVYSEAVSPLNTDDNHQIITINTNSIFVFIIEQSSYVYIHIYVEKYIFVCSSQFSNYLSLLNSWNISRISRVK